MTRNQIDQALIRLHVRARLDRSVMVIDGTDAAKIAHDRDNHRRELKAMGMTWAPCK